MNAPPIVWRNPLVETPYHETEDADVTVRVTLKNWTTTYVVDYNELQQHELDVEHGAAIREMARRIEEDLRRQMCASLGGSQVDDWPPWHSTGGVQIGGRHEQQRNDGT